MPRPLLQRSTGQAEVALDAAARVRHLRQQGSAKVFVTGPGELTFLNTSGGLAGGDRFSVGVTVAAGCQASATTQTAERAYRSGGVPAEVRIRLGAGPGARLDWLPQETILYDGASLDRRTRVDLAPGAACLLAETLVLGRAAMGETLRSLALRDRREVWQDGRLVWLDPLVAGDDTLSGPATLAGARALSTVVLVAPDAERLVPPLRRLVATARVRAGVSALAGRLILRLLADEAASLRPVLHQALAVLRDGAPFPRVWQI